jgi:hypothetical protein
MSYEKFLFINLILIEQELVSSGCTFCFHDKQVLYVTVEEYHTYVVGNSHLLWSCSCIFINIYRLEWWLRHTDSIKCEIRWKCDPGKPELIYGHLDEFKLRWVYFTSECVLHLLYWQKMCAHVIGTCGWSMVRFRIIVGNKCFLLWPTNAYVMHKAMTYFTRYAIIVCNFMNSYNL